MASTAFTCVQPLRSLTHAARAEQFVALSNRKRFHHASRKRALFVGPFVRAHDCSMTLATNVWEADRVPAIQTSKKVAIVGAGLGGLITAMELLDAGCEVDIYEARPFAGGKVGSWVDSQGNHIEMGLHVFFGCYYNLFEVMAKVGAFKSLLLKEHKHTFVNLGGKIAALDFRMGAIGAPVNGIKAFFATGQLGVVDKLRNALALGSSVIVRGLVDFDGAMDTIRKLDKISFSEWFISKGGTRGSIERLWNPVAYALGFIDCDNMSARCMLTIFQLFAARSEASVLRMLEGSPNEYLIGPICKYITDRGGRIHLRRRIRKVNYEERPSGDRSTSDTNFVITSLEVAAGPETERVEADLYVAACDVKGAQRLIPDEWRTRYTQFDNIFKLESVPVVTVQLRFDGWVTELHDAEKRKSVGTGKGAGLNNLLYSPDADFSCFADLALTSPTDYYKEGEGSLLQLVLTPGDPYMPKRDSEIVEIVLSQVRALFPSASDLNCTWSNVVKLAESLYREEPDKDPFRPRQETPVPNFFLAGSYTYQDYIDSMEGAVKSGRLAASALLNSVAAANEMV